MKIALLTFSVFAILAARAAATGDFIVVSVPDQRLALVQNGIRVAEYPVSTSRYGVGDGFGSFATPLGMLEVAQKIGDFAPPGAVFKSRRFTGEILPPNARGRDPIVTRIIWLRGLDLATSHAFERCIYIHGTPVEKSIGKPASYGCIRMRSRDVISLFDRVAVGARIQIANLPISRAVSQLAIASQIAAN